MMSRKQALRMISRKSTITSLPKSKFRMNHNPCRTTAVPYAKVLGYTPKSSTSDSNSSFVSPDPPKRQRGNGSTAHKQLTKPGKTETSLVNKLYQS